MTSVREPFESGPRGIDRAPTRPIRVLHVLAELKPSGAESMLRAAAEEFRRKGVEADILATAGQTAGPYADTLRQAGYTVHHLPIRKSPSYFARLFQFLRANRYDTVHLHIESATIYFAATARAAGVRQILRTVHNNFLFEGWLRFRRRVTRAIATDVFGLANIAISDTVRNTEAIRFGSHSRVIPNWYDSNRFVPPTDTERTLARRGFSIQDDERVIVSVGNCSDVKNHALLLRSLALLKDDRRWVYLHAGLEDARGSERLLAEQLGIKERVRFLGPVADVASLLKAADLYAMPSLFEGFSIAVLEALATGVPVILADSPGLRDFRPQYPRAHYHALDPASCADALKQGMAIAAEERAKWATEQHSTTVRNYGIGVGVAGYVDEYRKGTKT